MKNIPRTGKRYRPKTAIKGKRYRCATCHKRSPRESGRTGRISGVAMDHLHLILFTLLWTIVWVAPVPRPSSRVELLA